MASPVSPEALLEGADGYFNAAIALCDAYDQATNPVGLLSAHALEIALKSVLLKAGTAEKSLKNIGHDLLEAWQQAAPLLDLASKCHIGSNIQLLPFNTLLLPLLGCGFWSGNPCLR